MASLSIGLFARPADAGDAKVETVSASALAPRATAAGASHHHSGLSLNPALQLPTAINSDSLRELRDRRFGTPRQHHQQRNSRPSSSSSSYRHHQQSLSCPSSPKFTTLSSSSNSGSASSSSRTGASNFSSTAVSSGGDSSPLPATSTRAKLDDSKDRRLAKLRHRAKTMEPPVLSFYGAEPVPLPPRFASIKRKLVAGHEEALRASWGRLLAALAEETAAIEAAGPALIPSIDFAAVGDPAAVAPFSEALRRFGVGVVRGVVPPADAEAWVAETRTYLESGKHDVKPPPPQDPTCFDFFWTPAQIRARAHPNVLRAMKFAMGLWDGAADDERMAARLPISYADRIRIHVASGGGSAVNSVANPADTPTNTSTGSPTTTPSAVDAGTIIAQVDGGSLERWEPDGYGRSGTYDSVFRGDWEAYDPWDPAGRVNATPDLYNGAGACSIFRMFQGLLALTDVRPGMLRLLPSPKLVTAYFLLRPFFRPKAQPPAPTAGSGPEWTEALLAPDNWELETEPSTIIHGAVPGHAQRVTELWHPHLQLRRSLVAPPSLQAGDYIIWHCDTPYTITSSTGGTPTDGNSRPVTPSAATATAAAAADAASRPAPLMVYAPACPLTQTNALYLARQRKAFLRGHPGPDFDSTGSGLGSEAAHGARLGEREIRDVGGEEALRAMGLAPWEVGPTASGEKMEVDGGAVASVGEGRETANPQSPQLQQQQQAEAELVRLANIILFPDKYEFYMAARNNTPPEGARS